ncbi:MAG: hypothetical protein MRY83_12790, partial [Flavobacteriales bacterium]|nr:hypothetical protein [Flavobacteriales bacterium]
MRNLILSLLMISVSTLSAQTYKLDFSNWDKNRDGRIDKYEFVSVFKRQYASDKNFTQDKGLDDEDFYQYIFKRADLDQNGDLRGGEWQFEYDYYYDNA